jgi:hypothetical protein
VHEYRCFHSRTPDDQETATPEEGTIANGVVVCQHVFGVGVFLVDLDIWGHVNVTHLGLDQVRENFVDHPAIGAHLTLTVFGRTPSGQLRLGVR